MAYVTQDPSTEEVVATWPEHSDAQVDAALTASRDAFVAWRREPFALRGAVLLHAAQLLESRAEEHARLMALEMGKPLADGVAESRKCATACRHYAEHAEAYMRAVAAPSDASESFVAYEALGSVFAIMPWNFPFWQLFRFAAPALMAGNAVLLKHAPNTPQCALAIEALLRDAGLPAGVLQNLFLTNEQAARVIADHRIQGVTLTGSTAAGRKVAEAAGRALKTSVMELGGSDPFIVFADADLEEAVRVGVTARCLNSGQSCIAAKRFLVQRPVYEAFRERFVAAMSARVLGDPRTPGVQIGPQARRDLRDGLARQVSTSVDAGARLLCGGAVPPGKGFFYPATVLEQAPKNSPAASEELFGPVAVLFPFETEDEAVALANNTEYGLGASVWTASRHRALALAGRLESGAVFVNGLVKSDPRLPFGGVKNSGFGRELGREGLLEFTNQKTIWIK